MPMTAKERFRELMATVVAPMLKAEGFAKNALTFVRRRGDLVDVVNVQGSDRNGLPDRHSFFLNGAVLSTAVYATLGIEVPVRPRESDGLFRERAGVISGSAVDRIDITPQTDADVMTAFLRAELSALLELMDSLVTTEDLLDLVIERNGAAQSDEIVGYLARVGDTARLLRYLELLGTRLGGRANWPVIATRLRMAIGDLAPAEALALLPAEVVPWAAPPRWLDTGG